MNLIFIMHCFNKGDYDFSHESLTCMKKKFHLVENTKISIIYRSSSQNCGDMSLSQYRPTLVQGISVYYRNQTVDLGIASTMLHLSYRYLWGLGELRIQEQQELMSSDASPSHCCPVEFFCIISYRPHFMILFLAVVNQD